MTQRKEVAIDRGLYVVRYSKADDAARPPSVRVSLAPADAAKAALVFHPDSQNAILNEPGSCMIVRSAEPVSLVIEVRPFAAGGSIAAAVQVEPLPFSRSRTSAPQWAADAAVFTLGDFRITAHVAGIGDVSVAANDWIAGPAAPSRIEGIQVDWPSKPADLDIRYAVKLARPSAAPNRLVEIGSFAGTRGRAMPLTGVVFEMSGAASAPYVFAIEAAFLGSPPVRINGKRAVLSGPTGREPLVGLRVNVVTEQPAGDPPELPPLPTRTPPRGSGSGRVRVYRSRTKQDQASD